MVSKDDGYLAVNTTRIQSNVDVFMLYRDVDEAGSTNDHPSGSDVRSLLDSFLRRVDGHPAADRQLSATFSVPVHDARHSLGRLQ